ncbi:MAG: universal stress protein [Deltaproteobacteria bacterium]|nr:universal stress protein [Deltaproteobacteria bacterium]
MNKKILVAIDGSRNSLETLDYVNQVGGHCPGIELVLFHVLPPVPSVYKEDLLSNPEAQKYIRQWKKKHQEAIEQILHKSMEKMIRWGWAGDRVRVKSQEKRVGLARDILFEAHNGLYDAVVLGRRGLSKVEEFFLGSVSGKVLQGAGDVPVWLVGKKTPAPHILVALDGSENALRAVDHLSFVLESCPSEEVRVVLLNVYPGLVTLLGPRIIPNLDSLNSSAQETHRQRLEAFMDQAEIMLLEAGLSARQIKKKFCWRCSDIARAVLAEADKGDCGTIVLGRRGISKTQEFFLGSVSGKIIQQAGQKTVWVIS